MKSSADEADLTIGRLAEQFGLETHVLRHWESVGLLTPGRNQAGRRRYRRGDRYRIAAILRAKEAGLSLQDIHAMVSAKDTAARSAVLRQQYDELARHITEAQAALELLAAALDCKHGDIATCPRFRSLLTEQIEAAAAGGNSVQAPAAT